MHNTFFFYGGNKIFNFQLSIINYFCIFAN